MTSFKAQGFLRKCNTLAHLQVAVVIFSGKFWSSASCLEELTQIVELAEDQTILYVPVFMFKTVAEVRTAAHDWQGIDFAKKVRIRILQRYSGCSQIALFHVC